MFQCGSGLICECSHLWRSRVTIVKFVCGRKNEVEWLQRKQRRSGPEVDAGCGRNRMPSFKLLSAKTRSFAC